MNKTHWMLLAAALAVALLLWAVQPDRSPAVDAGDPHAAPATEPDATEAGPAPSPQAADTAPPRAATSAIPKPAPAAQLHWTPEAFFLLPLDQQEYTPTSAARAKWMQLHAFPTPESLARTDEDRLRDEISYCNRLSANTLIERLRQRGDSEWRSLAEGEAGRGSLFAARADAG